MTNMAFFETSQNKNIGDYQVLEAATQTGLETIKGVFGFGSCTYNGKLYYFFGALGYDRRLKLRNCTSQAIKFNPNTRNYSQIQLWHEPERLLIPRRYPTMLCVGKDLLCLGGINRQGYNLKELLCIDMNTYQWRELSIDNQEKGPGHINQSAMCLVAYKERDNLNLLDSMTEIHWD